jgi:hypothetical protein
MKATYKANFLAPGREVREPESSCTGALLEDYTAAEKWIKEPLKH